MRVFILGAGASKSYSTSPTQQRMPIARDFFQTFDQLDIAANPWVLRDGLLGYLHDKGINNPDAYLRNGVDIEVLHSEIEQARNNAFDKDATSLEYISLTKAYVQMVFIFSSVINEIQNGPISGPHINIARQVTAGDAIITFNWDTLMDRALIAETAWRPDWGYGIAPRAVFADGWRPPILPSETAAPKLLKLHGSTNWITAYPISEGGKQILTHDLDPATLYLFDHATRPYPCWAGRYMDGYQPLSYGYYPPNITDAPGRAAPEGHVIIRARPKYSWRPDGSSASNGLASMPLIIPPVQNKTYELFGTLFSNIWQEAESAITRADQIIIIGYSFPRTDLQSNKLFMSAFMQRKTMPYITIIDPAPERVAEKFAREFGINIDHLNIIKEYYTSDFDIDSILRMNS